MLRCSSLSGSSRRLALVILACSGQLVCGTLAHAAGFDCSRFEKHENGTWSAVQTTEIGGPTGRIDFSAGETYKAGELRKGLDIVKLLNANCVK